MLSADEALVASALEGWREELYEDAIMYGTVERSTQGRLEELSEERYAKRMRRATTAPSLNTAAANLTAGQRVERIGRAQSAASSGSRHTRRSGLRGSARTGTRKRVGEGMGDAARARRPAVSPDLNISGAPDGAHSPRRRVHFGRGYPLATPTRHSDAFEGDEGVLGGSRALDATGASTVASARAEGTWRGAQTPILEGSPAAAESTPAWRRRRQASSASSGMAGRPTPASGTLRSTLGRTGKSMATPGVASGSLLSVPGESLMSQSSLSLAGQSTDAALPASGSGAMTRGRAKTMPAASSPEGPAQPFGASKLYRAGEVMSPLPPRGFKQSRPYQPDRAPVPASPERVAAAPSPEVGRKRLLPAPDDISPKKHRLEPDFYLVDRAAAPVRMPPTLQKFWKDNPQLLPQWKEAHANASRRGEATGSGKKGPSATLRRRMAAAKNGLPTDANYDMAVLADAKRGAQLAKQRRQRKGGDAFDAGSVLEIGVSAEMEANVAAFINEQAGTGLWNDEFASRVARPMGAAHLTGSRIAELAAEGSAGAAVAEGEGSAVEKVWAVSGSAPRFQALHAGASALGLSSATGGDAWFAYGDDAHAAATRVQRGYRRHLTRRDNASRYIAATWRGFAVRRPFLYWKSIALSAAIRIQALVRGRLGRKRWRHFHNAWVYTLVVDVQRVWRGVLGREYARFCRWDRDYRMATTIQAVVRGRRDRLRVRVLRFKYMQWLGERRWRGILVVQRWGRGHIARTIYGAAVRLALLRRRAAIKMQSVVRGWLARTAVRRRCAVTLQRVARGMLARLRVASIRAAMEAREADRRKRETDYADECAQTVVSATLERLSGKAGKADVKQELKNVKAANKKKKMARKKMSKEERRVDEVREVFELYDVDGSGAIDAEELRAIMNELAIPLTDAELNAALDEMDEDGSGEVEFDEFLGWYMAGEEEAAEKKAEKKAAQQKAKDDKKKAKAAARAAAKVAAQAAGKDGRPRGALSSFRLGSRKIPLGELAEASQAGGDEEGTAASTSASKRDLRGALAAMGRAPSKKGSGRFATAAAAFGGTRAGSRRSRWFNFGSQKSVGDDDSSDGAAPARGTPPRAAPRRSGRLGGLFGSVAARMGRKAQARKERRRSSLVREEVHNAVLRLRGESERSIGDADPAAPRRDSLVSMADGIGQGVEGVPTDVEIALREALLTARIKIEQRRLDLAAREARLSMREQALERQSAAFGGRPGSAPHKRRESAAVPGRDAAGISTFGVSPGKGAQLPAAQASTGAAAAASPPPVGGDGGAEESKGGDVVPEGDSGAAAPAESKGAEDGVSETVAAVVDVGDGGSKGADKSADGGDTSASDAEGADGAGKRKRKGSAASGKRRSTRGSKLGAGLWGRARRGSKSLVSGLRAFGIGASKNKVAPEEPAGAAEAKEEAPAPPRSIAEIRELMWKVARAELARRNGGFGALVDAARTAAAVEQRRGLGGLMGRLRGAGSEAEDGKGGDASGPRFGQGGTMMTLIKLKLKAQKVIKDVTGQTDRAMARRNLVAAARKRELAAARSRFRAKEPPPFHCATCIRTYAFYTQLRRHRLEGCDHRWQ